MTPKEILYETCRKAILTDNLVLVVCHELGETVLRIASGGMLHSGEGFMRISNYNENLVNPFNWRIDSIILTENAGSCISDIPINKGKIVWKRTILTKKEIAEKFGIPEEELQIII